jgi:hypothetical protein
MGNAAAKEAVQATRQAAEALRQNVGKHANADAVTTVSTAAAGASRVTRVQRGESPLLKQAPAPAQPGPRPAPAREQLARAPEIAPLDMQFVNTRTGRADTPANADRVALGRMELVKPTAQTLGAEQRQGEDKPFTFGDTGAPSTTPLDAEAAAIAASVQAKAKADAPDVEGPMVSVQKLVASAPVDQAATAKIHEKNVTTVQNMAKFEGSIHTVADNSAGARSFAVWQALQANPALIDTPAALAQSSTAQAALKALKLSLPQSKPLAMLPEKSEGPSTALVPLNETQIEAFLGDAKSLDDLLLRDTTAEAPWVPVTAAQQAPVGADLSSEEGRRALTTSLASVSMSSLAPIDDRYGALPTAVQAWGPRPPETSPYDQLMLSSPDEEFMLDRGEVFELFARHKANPQYWTPEKLAELFGTQTEWVKVILEFSAPPVYVQVDGEAYGVYDIRPMEDLEKMK